MGRVAVQLFEPSTVTVSFFLENVAGAGTETDLYFNEDRCRSKIPISVDGRTFVGESENHGRGEPVEPTCRASATTSSSTSQDARLRLPDEGRRAARCGSRTPT